LTLGDVSVHVPGTLLPFELKREVDSSQPQHSVGRDDLTYAIWRQSEMGKKIEGVRLKINGEKFFLNKTRSCLVGYKTIQVPQGFVPELVEEYAGKFYVISPYIRNTLVYEISGEKISFHPHLWRTPKELLDIPDLFSHKYDGIMVYVSGREYRCKWSPTVEVQRGSEVWEVRMEPDRTLSALRNRYGKVGAPETSTSVIGRIQACLPGASLIPFLTKLSVNFDFELPEALQPLDLITTQQSSKVLFLAPGGRIALIRLPHKRLDCVGGVIEGQETPLSALIREIFEETKCAMTDAQLLQVGTIKETSDSSTWTTHLYLGWAPDALTRCPYIETFVLKGGSFRSFKMSEEGRPRQVWMAKQLDLLSETLNSWEQAYMYLFMYGLVPKPNKVIEPNAWVQTHALDVYQGRMRNELPKMKEDPISVSNFLWLPEILRTEQTAQIPQISVPTPMPDFGMSSTATTSQFVPPTDRGSLLEWQSPEQMPYDTIRQALLLKCIAQENGGPSIRAQDYYKIIHRIGGPSGRKVAMKWIEELAAQKLVIERPQIDGGGRRWILQPMVDELCRRVSPNPGGPGSVNVRMWNKAFSLQV
jgi:ADP-ribose pyrophosphatase YjhB (NUDIX family)